MDRDSLTKIMVCSRLMGLRGRFVAGLRGEASRVSTYSDGGAILEFLSKFPEQRLPNKIAWWPRRCGPHRTRHCAAEWANRFTDEEDSTSQFADIKLWKTYVESVCCYVGSKGIFPCCLQSWWHAWGEAGSTRGKIRRKGWKLFCFHRSIRHSWRQVAWRASRIWYRKGTVNRTALQWSRSFRGGMAALEQPERKRQH